MNFVNPSVELINEKDNFRRLEICGRICWKSEGKMTEDSAFPFFQRICKRGHTSVLEHSVIFVRTHNPETYLWLVALLNSYTEETGLQHYIRYSQWIEVENEIYTPKHREMDEPLGFCVGKEHLFSGNIRAWRKICERYNGEALLYDTFYTHPAFADIFENSFLNNGKHQFVYTPNDIEIVDSIPTDPKEYRFAYKHNIATFRIIADRGLIDEWARHRVQGISIESTRYCNYKESGVTFVFPYWFEQMHDDPKFASLAGDFGNRCYDTEVAYQEWMKKTNTPQMARGALTLWVKSEGAFTATIQEWIDILALRDGPAAHPEAQKVAKMIEKVLVEEVGVEDIWGVKDSGLQCSDVNEE